MVIDNRKLYEYKNNDTDIYYIVNKVKDETKYTLDLNPSIEVMNTYRENYFKMETVGYEIKAISYYKVSELMEIVNKLNINIEPISMDSKKKKSKKEIYELIIHHFR